MIDIEEVKRQLTELNQQLREIRKDLARNYAPRSEQVRLRRLAVVIVALAICGGTFVNNTAISRCFLQPPHGMVRRVCGYAFPGYGAAMTRNDQARQQFQRLLEEIPTNTARAKDLEARVARLEAAQKGNR